MLSIFIPFKTLSLLYLLLSGVSFHVVVSVDTVDIMIVNMSDSSAEQLHPVVGVFQEI